MSLDAEFYLSQLTPDTPVRYIKLGAGGAHESECLSKGELRIFYPFISHETAQSGDSDAICAAAIAAGRSKRAASSDARQIRDFYGLGEDALWITFSNGLLWWTFARNGVEWVEHDSSPYRMRRSIGSWRSTNANRSPLYMADLSGRLTKTAFYRETICELEAREYLIAKIKGEPTKNLARALSARSAMVSTLSCLIKALSPQDFELLIDLIFAQSGWQRLNIVGGVQKTSDLELLLPTTGERAFVQVKSTAISRPPRRVINACSMRCIQAPRLTRRKRKTAC